MAFDEILSLRIQKQLIAVQIVFIEKKMFGGNAFMIQDKMCIGVIKNQLMLRVMEEFYEPLLEDNHVSPMNFTGKTMKNFLFVEPEGFTTEEELSKWVKLAVDFGVRGIVKSKKKKK
ncbi:TfoX/Sxy family protein [Flavobacterium sp. NG2]|uniref:TfoX/Sxy family protein n=1 Tax=Flavobacterium sp. NG2 TaxID=3097547 RepID=UPI002A81E256|nr:TfoX/Sxy family protein [Flavobacterium sp. NG2]WPR70625.1 TfoX/Sxy family protein [Flavobacterium sp. NG2]